ncbi:MAG: carboxylesterase/lipase family protein [Stellaceae bacterium]
MPATVRTESGLVSGSGNEIMSYLGIPYAAPPVGALRWKPPQKPAPWGATRACIEFGDDPVQMPNIELRGPKVSEDCLSLNVYTPAGAAKAPVLVWFYGGAFQLGSGSIPIYDGSPLARKGVVVVTINYRVGIFGFMAHPALSAESPNKVSGNYGFLDQVAALKWVRENIAGFGGDPNNVTIFGESAGAVSVAAHLCSPLSKGLFHKAILQSPAIFRKLYTLKDAEAAAVKVVGNDLAALRAMSAEELLPKSFQIGGVPGPLTAPQPIRMIRDGWAFPEDERDAMIAGRYATVPMIVGGVEREGDFFVGRMVPISNLEQYRGFVAGGMGKFADEGSKLFPAGNDKEAVAAASDVFADSLFNYGVRALARVNAKSQKNTYRFVFKRKRGDKATPPSHVEDVPYVFGTLKEHFFGADVPTNGKDHELSEAMMGAWVRFAATGDPNGNGLSWAAYDAAKDNYIVFDAPTSQATGWRTKELDFFERMFDAA